MNPLQVGYVETSAGPVAIIADAQALAAWDAVAGAWSFVTLQARYFPTARREFPERGPNNAGATVPLPAPEAAALIVAGYATAVAGTPNQAGVGTN